MRCPTPITIFPQGKKQPSQSVPCGRCGACKTNRRNAWSFRLHQEAKNSLSTYFITLTYSDENLIYQNGIPTLRKTDFQNFIKRLRKAQHQLSPDIKIRYYGVGEYGTETQRPHYHAIIFNMLPELQYQLPEIWDDGNIKCDPISDARIHYTTKYHVDRDPHTEKQLRQPSFALMSRMPGIGSTYLQINAKWHKDNLYGYIINNGYKQALPRFYRDKLFSELEKFKLKCQSLDIGNQTMITEINRLKSLGIENPIEYIFEADFNTAKKVKNKHNQKPDLF